MFIALLGFFIKQKNTQIMKAFLVMLPLFVFVVFSWWCWWYGGSLGSRVMIDTYPFMAIGLGLIIKRALRSTLLLKISLSFALLFCVVLNLNQTWQYSLGMLHWDSMTKPAYQSIFLKDVPPTNFQELIKAPDYEAAKLNGE
jgi:hypothetical protein